MSGRRVVILGAGPAGLGAARGLAERGFEVDIVEANEQVGGNSGSFVLHDIHVDYGSHRLHPASDPEVLADIQALLGDDLLARPRHGRIRLLGRWIHFPLRPLDLLLRIHPRFALGVGVDLLRKALPGGGQDANETFASILERGLGRTICSEFYFPYARKMWGEEPEALSAGQARKRVGAGSIGKMLRRLLPGGAGSGAANTKGIFYYPHEGFGQISRKLREHAESRGARFHMGVRATRVSRNFESGEGFRVELRGGAGIDVIDADHVWSTIPSGILAGLLEPAAPPEVLSAAKRIELRSMILVYLVLDTDRFSEYDAHYFPGADITITRMSEPKNYAARSEPRGRTVLCAELPCAQTDAAWSMSDEALGELVARDLETAGLPLSCDVLEVVSRRLPAAYPIYHAGYEAHFDRVDDHLTQLDGLISFGRQGLFAHDNTHHALFMAYCAVDCLADGEWNSDKWEGYCRIFETHVVED